MPAHRKELPPLSRRRRVRLTTLAVAALVFSVVTLVARTRPLSNLLALVVAVGSPYVVLVTLSGLALAVLSRRILLSIVAVLVVVATAAVQVPWYYFGSSADVGRYVEIR